MALVKRLPIRMITGVHPDTGEIYLFDKKVNETIPPQIGYMPEERGLYKKMTIWDHLLYLAQLKGMTETDAKKRLKFWIERLEMKTWYTKKIEKLSKGITRKSAIYRHGDRANIYAHIGRTLLWSGPHQYQYDQG